MKKWLLQYAGLLIVLALLVAVFSLGTRNFFQQSTLSSIANQIPGLTFVAVGMTFVLIVAGIDLSVGAMLALSAAVIGVLMVDHDWSLWGAIPLGVLTGASCGAINGTISTRFRIPSFIVTLGMMEIARGLTKEVTDSQTKYIGSAVEFIGQPLPGILLSPAFLLALLVVALGQSVLNQTVFGRYCIAIGSNRDGARIAGIRTERYVIAVFVLSGVLCSLAGLTETSLLSSADPNAGLGIELAAIAACVIGGTSLMGGRGSVVCTFLGVLIMAVLQTGLAHMGVSDARKQVITGSVIVLAVIVDALRRKA